MPRFCFHSAHGEKVGGIRKTDEKASYDDLPMTCFVAKCRVVGDKRPSFFRLPMILPPHFDFPKLLERRDNLFPQRYRLNAEG